MRTTVLLDHDVTSAGHHIVRLLLRIEGEAPPLEGRLPLNLSVVLDRSGSMSGEKLAAARRAAAQLVRRLRLEDVVSVVAYDDEVITVAEPATGAAQRELPSEIERIESGGMTNLSGGWLRGRELVMRGRQERGANRILLLTDGLANVGITAPDKLVGLCAAAREANVTTTTIGFGSDYDESLLRAMAEAGGGNMYYIERADQAVAIFADETKDLLDIAAQNLFVTIDPSPAAKTIAVHHSYPRTQDGKRLRLDIGDLYAREPRAVLMEFSFEATAGEDEVHLGDILVTAQVVTAGSVEQQEIRLPIRVSATEGVRIEPEVRKELLYLETARARERAMEEQRRGDYAAASSVLREHHAQLAMSPYYDADLQEEAEDVLLMADQFQLGDVSEKDAKYLYQRSHDARRSRASKKNLISRVLRKSDSEES
jgi:Ca-activated chloride channel family protein